MSVVQIKGKNQTKETVEYYANGSYYDIPLTEQNGFLSTFPDAQKTYPYKVGEETYNIPENEVGGFLTQYPAASPLSAPTGFGNAALSDSLLNNELELINSGSVDTTDITTGIAELESTSPESTLIDNITFDDIGGMRPNNIFDYVLPETLKANYMSLPDSVRQGRYGADSSSGEDGLTAYLSQQANSFNNTVGYGHLDTDTLKSLKPMGDTTFFGKNVTSPILVSEKKQGSFMEFINSGMAATGDRDKRKDGIVGLSTEDDGGALEAFGRSAVTYSPEAAGGILAAAGGAYAGAKVAGAIGLGTGGPIGGLVGLILGGIGGGILAGFAKNKILEEVAPEFKADLDRQLAEDMENHPIATFAGQLTPALVAFKPSPKNLKNAFKFGHHLVKNWGNKGEIIKTKAGQEGMNNLINVLAGSTIEGGIEIGRQAYSEEDWNALRIMMAIGAGAIISEPNRVGQSIGFRPTKPFMDDINGINKGLKTSVELAMAGQTPAKTSLYSDNSLDLSVKPVKDVPTEGVGIVRDESGVSVDPRRPETGVEVSKRSLTEPEKTTMTGVDEVKPATTRIKEDIANAENTVEVSSRKIKDIDEEIKYLNEEKKIVSKNKDLSSAEKKEIKAGLEESKKALMGEKKVLRTEINKNKRGAVKSRKELKSVEKELEEFGLEDTPTGENPSLRRVIEETEVDADAIQRHNALKKREAELMAAWKALPEDSPRKIELESELQKVASEINAIDDSGVEWVTRDAGTRKTGVKTKAQIEAETQRKLLMSGEPKDPIEFGSYVRVKGIGGEGGKRGTVSKLYKNKKAQVTFDDGTKRNISIDELENVSRAATVRPKKTYNQEKVEEGIQTLREEGKLGPSSEGLTKVSSKKGVVEPESYRNPMEREKVEYTELGDPFVRQDDGSWRGQIGNRNYTIQRLKGEDGKYGWHDLETGAWLGYTKAEAGRTLQEVFEAPFRGMAYDSPRNIEGPEITRIAEEERVTVKGATIDRGRGRTVDRIFKKIDKYKNQVNAPRSHIRRIETVEGQVKKWEERISEHETSPDFNPNDKKYIASQKRLETALKKLDDLLEVEFLNGTMFGMEFLPIFNRIFDAFERLAVKYGSTSGKGRLKALAKKERELLDEYRQNPNKDLEKQLDELSTERNAIIDEGISMVPKGKLGDLDIEEDVYTKSDVGAIEEFFSKFNFLRQAQHKSKNKHWKSIVRMLGRVQETENRIVGTYIEDLRKFKIQKLYKKDREKLSDLLEGKITEDSLKNKRGRISSKDKKLLELRDALRTAYDRMHKDGILVGMNVKGYIDNYNPRMMNKDIAIKLYHETNKLEKLVNQAIKEGNDGAFVLNNLLKKQVRKRTKLADTLEEIMKSGQADNLADAYRKFRNYAGDNIFKPFHNLEKGRKLELPAYFWERDGVKVFERYLKGYAKRYAEVKNLGGAQLDDYSLNLKLLVNDDPNLGRKAKLMYETWSGTIFQNPDIGVGARQAVNLTGGMTSMLVGTKIGAGFATIPNLFQTLYSTWTRVGTKAYLKGIGQYIFSPKARSEMRSAGIVVDDAIKAMSNIEYDGVWHRFANFMLKYSGFEAVNKMNNYVSASAGKHYINNLYKKAKRSGRSSVRAKKALRRYGFNPDKMPSNERMADFMYRFATDTQLLRNIVRDPIAFHDPRFQWAFLFKKFGLKQTQLIKDDMRLLFKDKDYQGLMGYTSRLLAASYMSYHGVTGIRQGAKKFWSDLVGGDKEDFSRISNNDFEKGLDVLSTSGSLGVTADLVASSYFLGQPIKALTKTLAPVHVDFVYDVGVQLDRLFKEAISPKYSLTTALRRRVAGAVSLGGGIPATMAPAFKTPEQKKQESTQAKSKARENIFLNVNNAVMNGSEDSFQIALEHFTQYNMNYPYNPIKPKDVFSPQALEKYVIKNLEDIKY